MQIKFNNQKIELNHLIQEKEELRGFVVVDQHMNEIHSSDIKGIKIYLTLPSVDTSVCSLELTKFIKLLEKEEVTLISVSMDLPFALKRWCQANASENVIATSDFRYHAFSGATHTLMKEIGLFARSVILVDEMERIQYMEVVEDVGNESDYNQVLKQLKRMKKSAD